MMVDGGKGVILNISSQTAFAGGENRAVYAAAKAAVSQLTRGAAVEWGPLGVRVLALAPGRCLTRLSAQTVQPGQGGDRGLARVPLGRWGTAEEIAKLAVMLCSDAAGYVTGETVIADGGYVLDNPYPIFIPRCGEVRQHRRQRCEIDLRPAETVRRRRGIGRGRLQHRIVPVPAGRRSAVRPAGRIR